LDGFSGLQLLHERKPHLIILDLMMPHMDGWETCRSIRSVSKVPIIILSARGSQPDILKGLKMGADDYLVKPFYPEELQARVEAILRRALIPAPTPISYPALRRQRRSLINQSSGSGSQQNHRLNPNRI
jgi:DNA-binding response OmpR family regulator